MMKSNFFSILLLCAFSAAIGWFARGLFIVKNTKDIGVEDRKEPPIKLTGKSAENSANIEDAVVEVKAGEPLPLVEEKLLVEKPEEVNKELTSEVGVIKEVPTEENDTNGYQTQWEELQKLLQVRDYRRFIVGYFEFVSRESSNQKKPWENDLFKICQQLFKEKQLEALLEICSEYLKKKPGHYEMFVWKAKCYEEQKAFLEGAKDLSLEAEYFSLGYEYPLVQEWVKKFHMAYVKELFEKGLFAAAEHYLEELALSSNSDPYYAFQLARIFIEKKEFDNAEIYLTDLLHHETYGKDAMALMEQIEKERQKINAEILSRLAKSDLPELVEIPLVKVGNNFVVKASINEGHEVSLLVDTGASMTMVSEKVFQQLGYTDKNVIEYRWFKTAGGLVKKKVSLLESVQVGGIKISQVKVSVDEKAVLDFDGLLGMNFLSYFQISIDPHRSVMILKKKTP